MAHGYTTEIALSYGQMPDEELVLYARRGNQCAAEYLLGRYRALVESKARSYFMVGAEHEDVVQEGMIGLLKAIRDFSDDRLCAFRAFADLCVTRQIISAVKSAQRRKHLVLSESVSLDLPYGAEDASTLSDGLMAARPASPEQIVVSSEFRQQVQEQVRLYLSDLECRVLWSYAQGQSYQEMGAELGCAVKSIDNALQRAKRKMAHRLQYRRPA